MRARLHLPLQALLWTLAPLLDESGIHDSPSLLVMPASAALAALASRDWRWGLGAPAAGLGAALVLYTLWALGTGQATLGAALTFAAGIIPFHLLGTWLLLALFWWPGRKARARRAGA